MKQFSTPAVYNKTLLLIAIIAVTVTAGACLAADFHDYSRGDTIHLTCLAAEAVINRLSRLDAQQRFSLFTLSFIFFMLVGTMLQQALAHLLHRIVQAIKEVPERIEEMLFEVLIKAIVLGVLTLLGLGEWLRYYFT